MVSRSFPGERRAGAGFGAERAFAFAFGFFADALRSGFSTGAGRALRAIFLTAFFFALVAIASPFCRFAIAAGCPAVSPPCR
jgi:hypothetical protein